MNRDSPTASKHLTGGGPLLHTTLRDEASKTEAKVKKRVREARHRQKGADVPVTLDWVKPSHLAR